MHRLWMRPVSVSGLQQEVALGPTSTDEFDPSFSGRGPSATGGSPRQTPCLRCTSDGNRSTLPATVLAYFCRSCDRVTCRRSPPVATTGLHKGSICERL